MVNCVALVDDQLRVEDSPLLMEVGSAFSTTVGRDAGSGVVSCGLLAIGFLLQPAVNAKAANAAKRQMR
jgi:hypothetical protein